MFPGDLMTLDMLTQLGGSGAREAWDDGRVFLHSDYAFDVYRVAITLTPWKSKQHSLNKTPYLKVVGISHDALSFFHHHHIYDDNTLYVVHDPTRLTKYSLSNALRTLRTQSLRHHRQALISTTYMIYRIPIISSAIDNIALIVH
jgi:hypothetical protein